MDFTGNKTTESEEVTLDKMKEEQKEQQETLITKTDGTLAKLRASGSEPTPDESESESTSEQSKEDQTDESQSTDESTSEKTDKSESKDESTSEETSKETGQTDDTSDSEAGDESKLTQAEIRAAKHIGWSEEEITELEQANPDLAKKTCAKALESTNNLSKKFSELGKTAPKPAEPTPVVPVTPAAPEPKAIDFTALETQYEGDPIVGVLKQVVDQNTAQAAEIAAIKATGDTKVDAAQVQQDAAVSQQIDTFFNGPEITAYEGVYGKAEKDWDNLTQGQIRKRLAVVEQADQIQKGARQQGIDMPLDEAFERAHLLVTKDEQEQTIRKDIKAKATKRAKSLTLAPTDSVKVQDTGKKTVAKAVANAHGLLAKLRKGR